MLCIFEDFLYVTRLIVSHTSYISFYIDKIKLLYNVLKIKNKERENY